jgi:hypothetical protein
MSDPARNIEPVTPEQLLAFKQANPHHTPTKNERIRHQLGISEIRYYTLLHRAARSAEGISADPVTARRVREQAEKRARERDHRNAA